MANKLEEVETLIEQLTIGQMKSILQANIQAANIQTALIYAKGCYHGLAYSKNIHDFHIMHQIVDILT